MAGSIAELDGAEILFVTSNDPKNNFGHAGERITALAICEYSDAPEDVYVFACDRH